MTIRVELDAELSMACAQNHLRAKNHDRALADARRAVELDANNAAANHLLAYLYVFGPARLRSPEQALPLATKATELLPDQLEYRTTLAGVNYRLGQFREAIEVLESLKDKADGPAWFIKSMSHAKLDETDAARDAYRSGLQWWRAKGALTGPLADQNAALRSDAETLLIPKSKP